MTSFHKKSQDMLEAFSLPGKQIQNPPKELILAVTGHRNLVNTDAVTKELRSEFRRIKKRFPDTMIILLTALAKGADQVALQAFREVYEIQINKTTNCKAEVRAVLPMPASVYLENCTDDEKSKQEFDELLKAFAGKETILNYEESKNIPSDEAAKKKMTDGFLASLADYYAKEADVVIAIWDGVWNGKKGGTSDVVETLRRSVKSGQRCQIVKWLASPRSSNMFPANEAFTWNLIDLHSNLSDLQLQSLTRRMLSYWKPVTLTLLLLAVLATGTLGYLADSKTQVWDALLATVGHFSFNGFGPSAAPDANALLLRFSQSFAVIFVLVSAGVLMQAAFQVFSRMRLWLVACKGHDIVIGVGDRGQSLISDSNRCQQQIVAVDPAPQPIAKELCRRLGFPLLTGDAEDHEMLRVAGIKRARKVYVCTGSDELNMRITHSIASLYRHDKAAGSSTSKARNPELICAVAISNRENFQLLRNCLPHDHSLDLRIFNAEDLTARLFLRANHVDRFLASPKAPRARVILVGDSPMASAFLQQILQQGIYENDKALVVTCLCLDAKNASMNFFNAHPNCYSKPKNQTDGLWITYPQVAWGREFVLPAIEFHNLPISDVGILDWFEDYLPSRAPESVTTIIIACESSSNSLAVSAAIIPFLEKTRLDKKCDIVIWSHFNTKNIAMIEELERTLNLNAPSLPVRVFSNFMGRCTREGVDGSEVDQIARRINGHYDGIKDLDNQETLQQKWREISENDKDSNRQAAAHSWVKLRIRKRLEINPSGIGQEINHVLARCEHRRWCAEYLLKGFRPLTRIPSDPSLCPEFIEPNSEENEVIKTWFPEGDDSKEKVKAKAFKKSWKDNKRHIDLLPYDDLPKMLGNSNGKKEQKKDQNQTRELDLLIGLDS